MEIIFSRHARRQLKWRKITREEVLEIIAKPEFETVLLPDKVILLGFAGGRYLKVVIRKENERMVVITATVKKRKG